MQVSRVEKSLWAEEPKESSDRVSSLITKGERGPRQGGEQGAPHPLNG